MRMGPVSFCALLACAPFGVVAQTTGSLGAGTGVVRYSGGSSFSTFTLSPTAQYSSTWIYAGFGGSLSLLKDGVWAAQARSDVWGYLSHRSAAIRPAIAATISGTTRSDGVGAGSAAALLEAVQERFAVGAGFVTGVIEAEPGVGAFRLRARTWWQPIAPVELSFTTEATHFLGAWYTDVVGGASYDRQRIVGSVWISGRLSATYGSTGAASAAVQYFVTPRVALEASGGNYLRDPFQGLPRAGFIAGGVRVFAARRAIAPSSPTHTTTLQPLVATHRGGDTVVVRFRMPGARSLAIAGSWNDWKPDTLQGLGSDIWEAALRLPPGTYYFNLVVDGKDWVVPAGVATISDGMGGMIAVLNVL